MREQPRSAERAAHFRRARAETRADGPSARRSIIHDPGIKTSDLLRAIEIVFDRAFGKETYNSAPNELLQSLLDLERRAGL